MYMDLFNHFFIVMKGKQVVTYDLLHCDTRNWACVSSVNILWKMFLPRSRIENMTNHPLHHGRICYHHWILQSAILSWRPILWPKWNWDNIFSDLCWVCCSLMFLQCIGLGECLFLNLVCGFRNVHLTAFVNILKIHWHVISNMCSNPPRWLSSFSKTYSLTAIKQL